MSSAKRKSSNAGWPSPKSNPFKGASRLLLFIAYCGIAEDSRGLRTHRCLTPEFSTPLSDRRMFSSKGTVLLASLQALDTMLAIYIPAAPGCAGRGPKSKPVSLGGGWKSGVGGGLVTSARISLMEGVLPSRLCSQIGLGQGGMLQRHAWPHAWTWRSSSGSGRWWRNGAEGLGLGGLWCRRATSGKLRFHHSNILQPPLATHFSWLALIQK